VIEQGFRRGWADAVEGFESAVMRFHGDFLRGYSEGYHRRKMSEIEKKTLDEAIQEWTIG